MFVATLVVAESFVTSVLIHAQRDCPRGYSIDGFQADAQRAIPREPEVAGLWLVFWQRIVVCSFEKARFCLGIYSYPGNQLETYAKILMPG